MSVDGISVGSSMRFVRGVVRIDVIGNCTDHLRIDRNFCSVHEEITSIRRYTPCNPRNGLRKGAYNLIEVVSNEPSK